jgi:hypothetical protein
MPGRVARQGKARTRQEERMKNIPAEIYHEDLCTGIETPPSLSNSIAQMLTVSPKKAMISHPRLNQNFVGLDDKKFDIGTAAHDAFLEGGTGRTVCVNPQDFPGAKGAIPKGWTTNEIKDERDRLRIHGLIPLFPDDYQKVRDMADAAHEAIAQCEELHGLKMSDGLPERTLLWTEETASGVIYCRSRIDQTWVAAGLFMDYKTTDVATPSAWRRGMNPRGNPFQQAFYTRGFMSALNKKMHGFFMTQETEYPYDCYFSTCAPVKLEAAEKEVDHAMEIWGACMKAQKWPGYPKRIEWVEAQSWEIAEAEEKSIAREGYSAEDFLFGRVKNGN